MRPAANGEIRRAMMLLQFEMISAPIVITSTEVSGAIACAPTPWIVKLRESEEAVKANRTCRYHWENVQTKDLIHIIHDTSFNKFNCATGW